MRRIITETAGPLDPNGICRIPAMAIPSFRHLLAKERGSEKNWLLISPVSLGDTICMEPSVRFACEIYGEKGISISVLTSHPEVFSHLPVKVFDQNDGEERTFDNFYHKYYAMRAYYDPDEHHSEFFMNFNVQIVDYISLCLFKRELPLKYRQINLSSKATAHHGKIVIHPGKTWESRTVPGEYWSKLIKSLNLGGQNPIIVGTKDGTVSLDEGLRFHDRRGASFIESCDILRGASVVLTNDSSPLHMASAGEAWIGFFSTVKEPEYITHWRSNGEQMLFGWKMTNFSHKSLCASILPDGEGQHFDQLAESQLFQMLEDPDTVAAWALDRV